jgi:hypothetical protein
MKKKIQISEGNLISLIKRIVLEQTAKPTVKPITTKNPFEPTPVQNFNIPQAAVGPPVATGTEDMDTTETLAYRQQQQLAQQKKNQNRVCKGGYKEPTDGNYRLCSGGPLVGQLQKYLKIPEDNKFGLQTERTLFAKHKIKTITKEEITKLTNKNSLESNTANAQTQQPMQNNARIVVDIRGLGINQITKAFVENKSGNEVIQMTTSLGAPVYSTTCELLTQNKIWAITRKQFIDAQSVPNLVQKLNYNFCSKTATNINVTKLIKGGASVLPRNEQSLIKGDTFRAVIKPNKYKSIHIVSDTNAVVLYTDCNNLKTNTFYKNYGQTYAGKPIELPALGVAIKPSFCATK